jgi:2-polyprenyl-3-methyl-5-hydroxy-6-metoxy-1,4-benzoquinol methylase
MIRDYKCEICNNATGNQEYVAREMMFGLREKFIYFQCSFCGCLQIAESPNNMQPYYQSYHSHIAQINRKQSGSKILLIFKSLIVISILSRNSLFYKCCCKIRPSLNNFYKWMKYTRGLKHSSKILDIGSGDGAFLLDLNDLGFTNLTGVDQFIVENINYECGVRILKKEMSEIEGEFDLITLNHSLEHMPNPHSVFKKLNSLISSDGHLLIRIPLADSFAWRKYGVNWYQIDAPRHFFLHTINSISILAKENGLTLTNVFYDSSELQFSASQKYTLDKSLLEAEIIDRQKLKMQKKWARLLNEQGDGDQACFILRKN